MRNVFRSVFASVPVLIAAGVAFSQENNPGERLLEAQRERRQIQRLEQSSTGAEIETPAEKGPVEETPCIEVTRISLEGVTVYPLSRFDQELAAFERRCLGQVSISNLLEDISAIYADDGYITSRAYAPAQELDDGRLIIEVLEGRIEAFGYTQIDEDGQQMPGASSKLLTAMPQREGEVFQLRDLEQGLEQMNRLQSSQASANLAAGEAPGTSRIEIAETKSDAYRGAVSLNNRGDRSTGRGQLTFALEGDDILNLNDAWSVSWSGSENTNAAAFGVSVPFGKWLFSASGSYSEEFTPITSTTDLFTQNALVNLTAERLIFRNATSKYYLYGGLTRSHNERHINVIKLTPQNRTATRFGLRQEHRAGAAIIALDTAFSFGASLFGADGDPANLPKDSPRTKFRKIDARLNYIRYFESGAQFSLLAAGQLADRPLYSSEQLSIGGWQSVRGWSGRSASGENGAWMRSEFSFPATVSDFGAVNGPVEAGAPALAPVGLRPYLFADAGYVKARATNSSARMVSAGLGFSLQAGRASLNGEFALPVDTGRGGAAGEPQVSLGLSVKLF